MTASMELWVSIAAIVVAIFSLGLTCWLQYQIAKLSRKPALVFVYTEAGWELRNVGYGPALNVVMARQEPAGSDWSEPVRIPPLGTDSAFRVSWDSARHAAGNRWGATYEAIDTTRHTAQCARDRTEIDVKFEKPWPDWNEIEIKRPWELETVRVWAYE